MSEPLILTLKKKIEVLENKSAILVYNNATQNLNVGSEVTVNLNSFDEKDKKGNDFQLSNNTIICKKTGFIVLSYKIFLDSGFGESNNIICKAFKNNEEISRFQYRPGVNTGGHSFCSESRVIPVTSNDVLKLTIINYSSACKIGNTAKHLANSINAFYL